MIKKKKRHHKHGHQLIKKARLKSVVENFSERNALIEEYDFTPEVNDKHWFEKGALIFWLGSNTTLNLLEGHSDFHRLQPYLQLAYYVMLALDKHIQLLAEANDNTYHALCHTRHALFSYYNKHSDLLKKNPDKLFAEFQSIIGDMGNHYSLNADQNKKLEKIKQLCATELNRIKTDIIGANKPSPVITNKRHCHFSFFDIKKERFTAKVNFIATKIPIGTLKPFANYYSEPKIKISHPHPSKILLPGSKGSILEGVLVRKSPTPAKTTVLLNCAHIQAEDNNLSNNAFEFQKLFDADIVFVNHRNNSLKSGQIADNIHDLVDDTLVFIRHFQEKGSDIVLYGMCGGAPVMILAADRLHRHGNDFRLILDRTFDKYNNMLKFNNASRLIEFLHVTNSPFLATNLQKALVSKPISNTIIRLGLAAARAGMSRAKNNMSFSDIVARFPEEKVLILQAKYNKIQGQKFPENTDIFISPTIDMRSAFKQKRHHRRLALKHLKNLSENLALVLNAEQSLSLLFKDFEEFFTNCIRLIDNEKLRLDQASDKPTDLHLYKLFQLTTRDKTPLSQFFLGFYSKSPANWADQFKDLSAHSTAAIRTAVSATLSDKLANDESFITQLDQFIHGISAHKEYFIYAAYRIKATGWGNPEEAFKKLIASDLYLTLTTSDDHILIR